jgi:hypothetical protein
MVSENYDVTILYDSGEEEIVKTRASSVPNAIRTAMNVIEAAPSELVPSLISVAKVQ